VARGIPTSGAGGNLDLRARSAKIIGLRREITYTVIRKEGGMVRIKKALVRGHSVRDVQKSRILGGGGKRLNNGTLRKEMGEKKL